MARYQKQKSKSKPKSASFKPAKKRVDGHNSVVLKTKRHQKRTPKDDRPVYVDGKKAIPVPEGWKVKTKTGSIILPYQRGSGLKSSGPRVVTNVPPPNPPKNPRT